MRNVLVLSYQEDPHANHVCGYLKTRGVDVFRVDTERLIGNYQLTFDSASATFSVSDGSHSIVLDDTWSIWNRRVMDPDMPKEVPKQLEDIIYTETERTWDALLFCHKGKVVNRPQSNYAANNKIDQLCFARNYGNGIYIPETIMTNDPRELRRFYVAQAKICHKLQKSALVNTGAGNYLTTYNNLVTPENMKFARLIERQPSLFQAYIDKDYELRITALERKIVAIAIYSQTSEQSKIDFRRYDFENVEYAHIDLPDHVTSFCRDLLSHYNLSFGEIDMIRDKNGRYVFLEINPNGQWLWLELKSGYQLTADVAENLLD